MKENDIQQYNKMVGARIKFFRRLRKMSQIEVSRALGYKSSGTLSQIERGIRGMSKPKVIEIAKVLDVHPYVLLANEEMTEKDMIRIDMMLKLSKSNSPHLPMIDVTIKHAYDEMIKK